MLSIGELLKVKVLKVFFIVRSAFVPLKFRLNGFLDIIGWKGAEKLYLPSWPRSLYSGIVAAVSLFVNNETAMLSILASLVCFHFHYYSL